MCTEMVSIDKFNKELTVANSKCKYCGETITWAQEGGRWIPLDPEFGVSHQSSCVGKGSGVKLSPVRETGSAGARMGEEIRMKNLESRVTAIEDKMGMMTYKPFNKIK